MLTENHQRSAVGPQLRDKQIMAAKVRLGPAILGIALDRNLDNADCIVIHRPNEVFSCVWQRRWRRTTGGLDRLGWAKAKGLTGTVSGVVC